MNKSHSILPCGKLNTKTGNFKYGNIIEFWGKSALVLVKSAHDDKHYLISTWCGDDFESTSAYYPAGHEMTFMHDQTFRQIGARWIVVGCFKNDIAGLKQVRERSQQNSINVACFK